MGGSYALLLLFLKQALKTIQLLLRCYKSYCYVEIAFKILEYRIIILLFCLPLRIEVNRLRFYY